jgi:DNA-binding transcriptional MerR regulator
MPNKAQETSKLYYSIGEVAEMFDENTSLIRYWENEFDILKPKKNKKGNRMFTLQDIDNLKIIYYLVKKRGYTIEGAKQKLKDNKEDTMHQAEVVMKLEKIKSFLLDLKEAL